LHKTESLSPAPFLWTLHSEIMAGSLLDSAVLRACGALPSGSMTHTQRAIIDKSDIATALELDGQAMNLDALVDVALIYRICTQTGAPMTESLARIISSVRDQQRRQRLLTQEIASTKASVIVLAALPLMGALMGIGLGINPVAWFLHSALGAACGFCGVALEVSGWFWVKWLVRRSSRSA